MLFPKKVKYRKWQTLRLHPDKLQRPDTRGTTVAFGSFGLKAISPSRVTANQLESARRVISRTMGKVGKMWIRVFPDQPVTSKAAEVPMGKGKGDLDGYIFQVRPGRILFEVDGVSEEVARKGLRKAGMKLPVKWKIVSRDGN